MPTEPESGSAPETAYDRWIDLLFRGRPPEPRAFLAAHPELTDEERASIARLGGLERTTEERVEGAPGDTSAAGDRSGALPPSSHDAPPTRYLGGYRLGRKLGVGGMGVVYLGEDETLGRSVAV